jgi:hypothetical protein
VPLIQIVGEGGTPRITRRMLNHLKEMVTNSRNTRTQAIGILSGLLSPLCSFGLVRFDIHLDCHTQLVIRKAQI